MFEFEEDLSVTARIKVVGVGGGGGNAIKTMMRARLEGIDFTVINTDIQALKQNEAPTKIQIGGQLTKGLGAGANPNIGRDAAIEDVSMLQESLKGTDMIFITAGMGGGTGTGAAPVIAKTAKKLGLLTVGIVTKPFSFEGKKRMRQAEEGIKALQDEVDTLICIPNDNLLNLVDKNTPIVDSFKMADHVLLQAVRGISDLITTPGLINLDFADVNTIMRAAGVALMGTGVASGENRALEAARLAITSPLLENISISGATGLLLNITGSSNMTLFEVNEACKLIQQEAHENANIIFGSVIDDNMSDEISVTVIATGFDSEHLKALDKETSSKSLDQAGSWLNKKVKKTYTPQEKPSLAEEKKENATLEDVFSGFEQGNNSSESARNDMMTALSNKDISTWSESLNTAEPEPNTPSKEISLSLNEGSNNTQRAYPADQNLQEITSENSNALTHQEAECKTQLFGNQEESGSIFQGKKDISAWGESISETKQPRSKRPTGNPSSNTQNNSQQIIHEVNIDGEWTRKPTKFNREQSEFKKTLREMSTVNTQDDDVYDIPAFIRRRAD